MSSSVSNASNPVLNFLNSADKNALEFLLKKIKTLKTPREIPCENKLLFISFAIDDYDPSRSIVYPMSDVKYCNAHLTLEEMKNQIIDFIQKPPEKSIREILEEMQREIDLSYESKT